MHWIHKKSHFPKKFERADFPTKCICNVTKRYEHNGINKDQQDGFTIPSYLYEEPIPRIAVEFLFCELNENRLCTFTKTFNCFPNDSYELNVMRKTNQVTLFPLKDKHLYLLCKCVSSISDALVLFINCVTWSCVSIWICS